MPSGLQTGTSMASYYDNVSNISEHSINPNHSSNQSLQMPISQTSSAAMNTRLCSLPATQSSVEINASHLSAKLPKKESIAPAMPLPTRLRSSVAHDTSSKKNGMLNHKNITSFAGSPKAQSTSTVSTMNNEIFSDIQNITDKISKLDTGKFSFEFSIIF